MTFEELSQELRKARLAKKWRPRDIARTTRIQYEYIKLLESGDFTFMPDPIIRGYIKSYSRDVGLEQNEMIEKYEQAKAQAVEDQLKKSTPEPIKTKAKKEDKKKVEQKVDKQVESKFSTIPAPPPKDIVKEIKKEIKEQPEDKAEEKKDIDKKLTTVAPDETIEEKKEAIVKEQKLEKSQELVDSEIIEKENKIPHDNIEKKKSKKIAPQKSENFLKRFRSELVLAGFLLIVIVVIIFIYLKFGIDYFAEEEEPIKKITVFEAREQNLEEEAERDKAEKQIRVPETVKLRIFAAERTWVRMVIDSTDTTEYMFSPGTAQTFAAKNQLELRMGRADGLLIWVNEDSVGKLGTAAEIVRKLVVTPQGIITKEIRTPQPPRPAKRDTTVVL